MYNYGYGMGMNVGCPTPPPNYGLAYAGGGYPLAFGAAGDATAEKSFTDKAKDFLGEENSLVGVKNGYILGGAAAAGLLYLAYAKRWI
jgi:hypothetical protein